MKFLFLDTETTGLDPIRNGILTISYGFVETDNFLEWLETAEKEQLRIKTIKMKPLNPNNIDSKALKVNGIKLDDINKFRGNESALIEFNSDLQAFAHNSLTSTYDKIDVVGYNVEFDMKFIKNWLKYYGLDLFDFVNYRGIDVMNLVIQLRMLDPSFLNDVPNLKQTTIAKKFNISIDDAHTSDADTNICYKLFIGINKKINKIIYEFKTNKNKPKEYFK